MPFALAVLLGFLTFAVVAHVQARAEQDSYRSEGETTDAPVLPTWGSLDLWGVAEDQIEASNVQQAIDEAGGNLIACATMVATTEGTEREPDPYRVCYGYKHRIESFADHPAVTGEWRGESLANLGASYANKVSTAAGRYQIIKPTWLRAQSALGLQDFSPESQDLAFAWLVKSRGALDDVIAGNIEAAIPKLAKEWASLPGANAPGQGMRSLDFALTAYSNAGGSLA